MSGDSKSQKQLAIDTRQAQVSELYRKRKSQVEIAELLGVNQATVSRDISNITQRWQEAVIANLDAAKREELARIDLLEREYWLAWERSCEQRERSVAGRTEKGEAMTRKAQVITEGRDGNPSFLAGVQWCIDRRCKILGLDAPVKMKQEIEGSMSWREIVEKARGETSGSDGAISE